MSEYQYYEFHAIDRPLTAKEMNELRSYSSRAHITPTSFVNDYSWGNFKGNEDLWMERYFDAFLYLANWGTHELMLRLPSRLLDPAIAKKYCAGGSAVVRSKDGKVILSFLSEDEVGGGWAEGEGQLSAMISLRAELGCGDRRALYLGWLLRAQAGELDDEEVEPPVPPGLGQLSASQESLVEFLRLNGDLLHVAAATSQPLGDRNLDRHEVRARVANLTNTEKDEMLTGLIVDADHALVTEMRQRFLREQEGDSPESAETGRTVGYLLHAAEACTVARKRLETANRAKEKARHERMTALAREKRLDSLVGCDSRLWAEVNSLIATKQQTSYDQAVTILTDLRDLDARSKGGDYRLRLEALHQAHSRKPSFIERLKKAGL